MDIETVYSPSARARFRVICLLLVITALLGAVGRIMCVQAPHGETPMLSANDRSRWCTIAALVDHGTYEIDAVIEQKHWSTIDRVKHRGPDGREHSYSSKPALLPTLLAGEYWVIQKALRLTLAEHPFFVMRLMLVLTNVTLLGLYFWMMVNLVESYGKTKWGCVVAVAAITWGTFLTTFAVTLNNHLPAAVAVLAAISLAIRIERRPVASIWLFAGAGLAAGFAVANELPALSFLVLLGAWLFRKSASKTLIGYLAGVLLVAVAFFGTNYLAHKSLKPAYAHRSDGPVVVEMDRTVISDLEKGLLPAALQRRLAEKGVAISNGAEIFGTRKTARWMLWDEANQRRLALVSKGKQVEVRSWDNWYEYPGSYWIEPNGIDRGESSRLVYAFHVLIGHHGVFSLTPLWILSFWGAVQVIRKRPSELFSWAIGSLLLTCVCLAFYLARPLGDRNYGGFCSGFRWLFWLIPFWVITLLPALDRIASKRFWRMMAYVALGVGVVSASYGSMNPWSHPWIYDVWTFLGWLPK